MNILIGVCGGIASYKVCELVRELKRKGHSVKTILTPFAEKFMSPLTFQTLSGNKAYTDKDWEEEPLAHINLARWADVFLIAPATANTIAKIANGISDNLLTTTILAYGKPLLVAPAMNTVMYKSPSTQENLKKLKEWGHVIIEPEFGVLACKEVGEGKLASIDRLIDWIYYVSEEKPLKGKKVLITCGATKEFIDPVRFISNYSSGEMGFSLARIFRWKGAEVKVIAGTTTAKEPPEVEIIRVQTTEEMREKVLEHYDWADIVVMNAAVADFKPSKVSKEKIKKRDKILLELVKNPDILEELGRKKGYKILVGFALESDNLLEYAREKLERKNLDLIVANPVKVMGKKEHEGYLITKDQIVELPKGSKLENARFIVEFIIGNVLRGGE
ncbi:bifunctional phosphopantothenoylcysteine decarboxylase/phosphopantothenate--cysteine ligase CoaBC [Aquifex aeolicus]|uniref:Coenzyme A biosynthesis bifunctional protein CoaBC n=1 Tax=Aquifex aeolicus (strain VF5) TaxID=224324 RepID=O66997_AQUAE|nr:bifunctional phosphopantothenoylcysteine decarboxylase/phosphopantothenate--cysteine ligase CoaBC [Aquifex aeolicus]AAC06944.1 pantothenate metabolism flavoprotein [Aquifex aeolicus VF5]